MYGTGYVCTYVHEYWYIWTTQCANAPRSLARVYTYSRVQDIFALARSSAAITKNVPILWLRSLLASTLNPTRARPPFSVISVLLDRTGQLNLSRIALDARMLRWLTGSIGFPREIDSVRSIPLSIMLCLTANYVFFLSRASPLFFTSLCFKIFASILSVVLET